MIPRAANRIFFRAEAASPLDAAENPSPQRHGCLFPGKCGFPFFSFVLSFAFLVAGNITVGVFPRVETVLATAQERKLPPGFYAAPAPVSFTIDSIGNYQRNSVSELRHKYQFATLDFVREEPVMRALNLSEKKRKRIEEYLKEYDAAFTKLKSALKSGSLSDQKDREYLGAAIDAYEGIYNSLTKDQREKVLRLRARYAILANGPLRTTKQGITVRVFGEGAENILKIGPRTNGISKTKRRSDSNGNHSDRSTPPGRRSKVANPSELQKILDRLLVKSDSVYRELLDNLTTGFPESLRDDIRTTLMPEPKKRRNLNLIAYQMIRSEKELENGKPESIADPNWLGPFFAIQTNGLMEYEPARYPVTDYPWPLIFCLRHLRGVEKPKLELSADQNSELLIPYQNYSDYRSTLAGKIARVRSRSEFRSFYEQLTKAGEKLNAKVKDVLLESQKEELHSIAYRAMVYHQGIVRTIESLAKTRASNREFDAGPIVSRNRKSAQDEFLSGLAQLESLYFSLMKPHLTKEMIEYLKYRPEDVVPQVDLLIMELESHAKR